MQIIEVWNNAGPVLLQMEQERTVHLWKRHLHLTDEVDELRLPTRHLVTHLVVGSAFFGDPKAYSCWLDESLNRELKKSCRTVSQTKTFEAFLLLRMRERLRELASRSA